jgi:hypothetical protein
MLPSQKENKRFQWVKAGGVLVLMANDNDKAAAGLAKYLLSLNHSNQYQSQYKLISQQS